MQFYPLYIYIIYKPLCTPLGSETEKKQKMQLISVKYLDVTKNSSNFAASKYRGVEQW